LDTFRYCGQPWLEALGAADCEARYAAHCGRAEPRAYALAAGRPDFWATGRAEEMIASRILYSVADKPIS
jgi:hypothetical protein